MTTSKLAVYRMPDALPRNADYTVRVRLAGEEWQQIDTLLVKVDMHHVREASMASFDFEGEVEVEIVCHREEIEQAIVRPVSAGIAVEVSERSVIKFRLDKARKLSIEVNGDRFHNLHLFAKPIENEKPDLSGSGVAVVEPGIHRPEMLLGKIKKGIHTLYFKPGMHHIEQVLLSLPSGIRAYIAGGAVIVGSFVCDQVRNVRIDGRGIIYLADFGRFSAFRGVRVMYSGDIEISGIAIVDPPHYSVYLGQSERVHIHDIESFSTRGWSDGIDMMACSDITVEHVFMRNSDDCIAIYGHRWGYYGNVRNITVRHSVLWADVAHPTMIGTHGDYLGDGNIIENIRFEDLDILEHHEPQERYRGCLAINAGDKNVVRNVTYENIRIEPFELGRVIDLLVAWNPDYNPEPGGLIEGIRFINISCMGDESAASSIQGFDETRAVNDVWIENFYRNGIKAEDAKSGGIDIGPFTRNITFR